MCDVDVGDCDFDSFVVLLKTLLCCFLTSFCLVNFLDLDGGIKVHAKTIVFYLFHRLRPREF